MSFSLLRSCFPLFFFSFKELKKNTHAAKEYLMIKCILFPFSCLFFTSNVLVYSSLSIRRERAVSMKRKESNRASRGKNIFFIVVVAIERATQREKERIDCIYRKKRERGKRRRTVKTSRCLYKNHLVGRPTLSETRARALVLGVDARRRKINSSSDTEFLLLLSERP